MLTIVPAILLVVCFVPRFIVTVTGNPELVYSMIFVIKIYVTNISGVNKKNNYSFDENLLKELLNVYNSN